MTVQPLLGPIQEGDTMVSLGNCLRSQPALPVGNLFHSVGTCLPVAWNSMLFQVQYCGALETGHAHPLGVLLRGAGCFLVAKS